MRQQKGAQVVAAELQLEAISRELLARGHSPCVVDQRIDAIVAAAEVGHEAADLVERGQVQLVQLNGGAGCAAQDLITGRGGLDLIAAGQAHGGAAFGQVVRNGQSNAGVAPCDDDNFAHGLLMACLWMGPCGWQWHRQWDGVDEGPHVPRKQLGLLDRHPMARGDFKARQLRHPA